jgi:hypothetical protein
MKKIITIFLLIIILTGFLEIGRLNYKKHLQIKENLVNHPENLPTKNTAKSTAFWFKNLKADMYRLQTIQYIGWNAISSKYKKYLYQIIDVITELNPYFEHPYIIWELLLPDHNYRYENLSEEEQLKHILEAEKIGLKWVKNFCTATYKYPNWEKILKIELIKEENNLEKIWTEERYKNPCKKFSIPYYLAYIYYYYKKDPLTAAKYYKIASANEDSLEWAKIMAAIMQWKWWEREKSYFMFLNIAKFIESEDKTCNRFASELEIIWENIYQLKKWKLDNKIVKAVSIKRNALYGKFDEKKETEILSDTKCSNYVNKAVRELNLAYIEKANKKYKEKNNGRHSVNAKQLFDEWYLKYLPIDFQQYKDYGIIYEYNPDTWNYDYEMGSYDE